MRTSSQAKLHLLHPFVIVRNFEGQPVRRLAQLLSLLLVSSTALAGGPTYNWTVHNSNTYQTYSSATETAMQGIAATWTLPANITVTRVEYESSAPVMCVYRPVMVLASSVSYHYIFVNTTTSAPDPRYTDSGRVAWTFGAGTKLLVESDFVMSWSYDGQSGTCNIPPGNLVISYTTR